MSDTPLLEVTNLKKYFPLESGLFSKKKEQVHAVDDVSFVISHGQTLGLVGESGSGKTTTGRCVLRLIEPTAGRVTLNKTEITGLSRTELKKIRRNMQIIFQDPFGSLTPRLRLYSILKEPLAIHSIGSKSEYKDRIAQILRKVGLRPEHMTRFPHEFSGGQRQRIAIARALMLNPDLIIADEPVSALDVSIQAQILNLMVKLQKELGLSYLLITHDLSVVKYMADRIAVMYLGKIVEIADRDELYLNPLHPYTVALMSAIPRIRTCDRRNKIYLGGEVPSPINPPSGCSFHPRCSKRMDLCIKKQPKVKSIGGNHMVACHLHTRGQND
jgi:oligopeptide transport system ATP-binding protein